MTVLSDVELRAAIETCQMSIDPFDPGSIGPASIDLRLGEGALRPQSLDAVHLDRPDGDECAAWPLGVIGPGEFILAHTLESVSLGPGLCAQVAGRSSVGRRGLAVHVTAGFVDPGWSGQLTLELFNHRRVPIVLEPGLRICQLVVSRLGYRAERPYGVAGRYSGRGVEGSRGVG